MLHGWAYEEAQEAAGRNQETEYKRYLANQDALWNLTKGMVWDGIEYPCMCRTFMHAHYHRTARHQEGAR
eukprot:12614518-Heterocapsa_arctica.AAC.1